jgi:hypothetical protein
VGSVDWDVSCGNSRLRPTGISDELTADPNPLDLRVGFPSCRKTISHLYDIFELDRLRANCKVGKLVAGL